MDSSSVCLFVCHCSVFISAWMADTHTWVFAWHISAGASTNCPCHCLNPQACPGMLSLVFTFWLVLECDVILVMNRKSGWLRLYGYAGHAQTLLQVRPIMVWTSRCSSQYKNQSTFFVPYGPHFRGIYEITFIWPYCSWILGLESPIAAPSSTCLRLHPFRTLGQIHRMLKDVLPVEHFGSPIRFREYSFLQNQRLPKSVCFPLPSLLRLTVC